MKTEHLYRGALHPEFFGFDHTKQLVESLRAIRPKEWDDDITQLQCNLWYDAVRTAADVCDRTIPRFDRTRFLQACCFCDPKPKQEPGPGAATA